MTCRACGHDHNPGLRCEVAARVRAAYAPKPVADAVLDIDDDTIQLGPEWCEVPATVPTAAELSDMHRRIAIKQGTVPTPNATHAPLIVRPSPPAQDSSPSVCAVQNPIMGETAQNATITVVNVGESINAPLEPTANSGKQAKPRLTPEQKERAAAAKMAKTEYMRQYMAKRRAKAKGIATE